MDYINFIDIITINNHIMFDQSIDFGTSTKKILVNPSIPLQMINLKLRASERIQATILGKIYSNNIEILQIVPIAICAKEKVKTIDFVEHAKTIENIMAVYSTMQILGVCVTDLQPDLNLAVLHTMYLNKQSGFKSQGILTYPIILSLSTQIQKLSNIQAYTYNPLYRYCKDILNVTSFEKLDVEISFGDTNFESMTPLFEALNDQNEIIPRQGADKLIGLLASRLTQLKKYCETGQNRQLKVKLREIVDKLNANHQFSMEQLSYLLNLTGLHKRIALKLNKFV